MWSGAWLFVHVLLEGRGFTLTVAEWPHFQCSVVRYHEDLAYNEDFGLQGGDEVTTSSGTPHVPDTTR